MQWPLFWRQVFVSQFEMSSGTLSRIKSCLQDNFNALIIKISFRKCNYTFLSLTIKIFLWPIKWAFLLSQPVIFNLWCVRWIAPSCIGPLRLQSPLRRALKHRSRADKRVRAETSNLGSQRLPELRGKRVFFAMGFFRLKLSWFRDLGNLIYYRQKTPQSGKLKIQFLSNTLIQTIT